MINAATGPAVAADCDPRTTEAPWGRRLLDPSAMWPLSRGDGVRVAVIDSGVSDAHPVLTDKVRDGGDYTETGEGSGCDLVGHGTLIAGMIAGRSGDEDDPASVAKHVIRDGFDDSTLKTVDSDTYRANVRGSQLERITVAAVNADGKGDVAACHPYLD